MEPRDFGGGERGVRPSWEGGDPDFLRRFKVTEQQRVEHEARARDRVVWGGPAMSPGVSVPYTAFVIHSVTENSHQEKQQHFNQP